jgi:hypothetical protein
MLRELRSFAERKCDAREMFDEEAAKGKGFYYRGL